MGELGDPTPVPRARKRVASIQDVAERAAVSIATVSRAVNKPHLVSTETAERVRVAIEELGYRPNRFAQVLMTQRSGLLGVALPDIHGEFYSEILRGADAEARRLGFQILVSASPAHPDEGEEAGGGLGPALGLVDGLAIMVTEPDERLMSTLRGLDVPLVVIDARLGLSADVVFVDQEAGSREAMRHLLEHTPAADCFFVGGPETNFDALARASVFAQALRDAGHTARPDQVMFREYSMGWGERWAHETLGVRGLRRIAVFAGNDDIAIGIMREAQALGLNVPHDVRLIGFDGSTLAGLVRPGISSVRVPRDDLGRCAVRALVARVQNPEDDVVSVRLPTTLIVRESSGPHA